MPEITGIASMKAEKQKTGVIEAAFMSSGNKGYSVRVSFGGAAEWRYCECEKCLRLLPEGSKSCGALNSKPEKITTK